MKVSSLLNPSPDEQHGYCNTGSSEHLAVPYPKLSTALPKRQKIAKDAPIFSEGNKIVGFVNYAPHEAGESRELQAEHQRFQVFPLGEIHRKGIRHIPYNSDKKDLFNKTGRDAFEMFQYTYKRPGEEKEYVVVWDYNVGLVRMTPFFKSCKFTKTVPAKALAQNPGLKDISYSITGGALVCQGYWMPYQAAKAIAATFCYDIRWALTPVFGNDFPSMCLRPKDSGFAKFLIDPEIVRYCAIETDRFRREGASYRLWVPVLSPPSETKGTFFESSSSSWKPRTRKQRRLRPADSESEYGTDTSKRDNYAFSPHMSPQWTHVNAPLSPASLSHNVSPRSQWTAINRSLSPATPSTVNFSAMSSPVRTQAPPLLQMPTPTAEDPCDEQFRTKRTHSKVAMGDDWNIEDTTGRPQTAGVVSNHHGLVMDSAGGATHTNNDIEAADILLSLGVMRKVSLPPTKRTRRGSTM